jgi:hypothetical protein
MLKVDRRRLVADEAAGDEATGNVARPAGG